MKFYRNKHVDKKLMYEKLLYVWQRTVNNMNIFLWQLFCLQESGPTSILSPTINHRRQIHEDEYEKIFLVLPIMPIFAAEFV